MDISWLRHLAYSANVVSIPTSKSEEPWSADLLDLNLLTVLLENKFDWSVNKSNVERLWRNLSEEEEPQ